MKKLLLSALLSVLFMGGAFAQMRWQSDAIIGQTLKAVNSSNKDTLLVNFQSSKTACSAWAPAKAAASLGKDSVVKVTCQTQKGIQVKAFLDNVTTSAYEDGSFKCNNAGSNGNPGRAESIDSLKKYLIKSIGTVAFPTINGSTSDSLTRPAACLFNYGVGEIAFGMYPGKATKIEYIYRFDFSGKTCTDDISFDMWTYDLGTTGLPAVYELAVYKSSVSDANLIGNKVNIYTTGYPLKKVYVAAETGVGISDYTNKSLFIVVKTLGTNGTGIAHARDVNNLPTNVDPTVVFDNFFMTYQAPVFVEPISTATNSNYLNYNNGTPVVKAADAGMTNLGTAVPITTGVSTPMTIKLKSTNRVGTFTVMESFAHNTNVSYALASAFKANDGSGTYSVPVVCTEAINATTSMWTLTIAAPTAGTSVVDDMQFTYNVNKAADGNTQLRLEISNGSARFWYDFLFTASSPTSALEGNLITPIGISTSNTMISVINATQDISIYTLSGQKVALLTANNAMNGVAVKAGAYIIKHGSDIRKVIVK